MREKPITNSLRPRPRLRLLTYEKDLNQLLRAQLDKVEPGLVTVDNGREREVPSGRIERGETAAEAVVRELGSSLRGVAVIVAWIGIAVAIGVILDTFIIRSTLVPALAYDIGRKIWWPGKLARQPEVDRQPASDPETNLQEPAR